MSDYYVYVYIDPRNHEEFYYGKGIGSRKDAHLFEDSDSEKSKRIKAIRKEGLEPIIRVIASQLTDHDALLVEKTLLWKLGKHLTNISSGHYADKFRPQDTLHKQISGFDFNNGVYFYNVGENAYRNWDDYKKHGFISAGRGERYRDAMLGFRPGDVFATYLKGHGFVGVGRVTDSAKPIRDVVINGQPLLNLPLVCKGMGADKDNNDLCEYVCKVEWVNSVDRSKAKWQSRSGLYTPQLIRAALDGQPKTIEFLNNAFGVDLLDLIA